MQASEAYTSIEFVPFEDLTEVQKEGVYTMRYIGTFVFI